MELLNGGDETSLEVALRTAMEDTNVYRNHFTNSLSATIGEMASGKRARTDNYQGGGGSSGSGGQGGGGANGGGGGQGGGAPPKKTKNNRGAGVKRKSKRVEHGKL